MQNTNTLKKIIIILILLVISLGIYFGVVFYRQSQNQTGNTSNNTNPNRTPFQTKVATGTTDIRITNPNVPDVVNPINTNTRPQEEPRLIQLWKQPVSGADFITKDIETLASTTGSSTVSKKNTLKNQNHILFWDRATGNIYENLASTSQVVRISNHTSPRAEEVFFISPTSILARELDANNENIITSLVTLTRDGFSTNFFGGTKKNIPVFSEHISFSPETKKIFYFLKNSGSAFVSNVDLSSTLKVLETSLTEWIPQYVNKSTLAITTKPSAYFEGFLFFVNSTGSQDNQYILGQKYGFTTLISPDGTKVLYSEIEKNFLETSIYDIKTKTTIRLDQSTLTEKCVWSENSKKIYCAIPQKLAVAPYPDAWYQRTTEFSDNIWSINPSNGEFELEIPIQDLVSAPVDAYNLKVAKNNTHLIFQDMYTLSLWKYSF